MSLTVFAICCKIIYEYMYTTSYVRPLRSRLINFIESTSLHFVHSMCVAAGALDLWTLSWTGS
eukprot:6180400-Pleurochrysis_carterae.AAC.5